MAHRLTINLVALISGNGSNLQAILDNISTGTLSARMSAVVSDRADAYGLTCAARAGIPALVVSPGGRQTMQAFYCDLLHQVEKFEPDLVVLAGFMRILPADFVKRFAGRMMNIHPSLLPKFKGLNTHQRALDAGERRHGASVHFVTAGLDDGPIIVQSAVEIGPQDSAESLQKKVLQREHRIYSQAIQWFAEGRITVVGKRALVDGESRLEAISSMDS